MWTKRIGLALLAALIGGLGGGCNKPQRPPLVLHPPPVETVAAIHWLGKQRLAADTNAASVMTIWNLPESQRLEAQTLDRLAVGLLGTNAGSNIEHPTSNIQHPTSSIQDPGASNPPAASSIQPLPHSGATAEGGHPASSIQHPAPTLHAPTNPAPRSNPSTLQRFNASTLPAPLTGPAALVRPLLDDVLQQESFLEVRAATNLPGDLTFAIRLTEPRARLWETNIAAIAESLAGAKPEVSNLQSQISNPQPAVQSTNEPPAATPVLRSSATAEGGQHESGITYHVSRFTFHSPRVTRSLEITRAGEWTVLGLGHGTNVLTGELLDRIQQGGLASDPQLEAVWLHADFDLGRVASALMLDLSLPADLPRMTADITGDGKNVRTRGQFNFPKPLPADLPPWNIPTNLIHDPLSSFTAIRSLVPWLSSFKGWTDLQIGPPPDQLYVWAQSGLPFLTYCAAPLPDASNTVYHLTERLLQKNNPELATNGMGKFARATNFNGVLWNELPIMEPSLRSVSTVGGDFVYASLALNPVTNRPAPPALLYQVISATNIVAYDWELTGPRVMQWLFTSQFFRMALHHAQVPAKSPSVVWLMALEERLGNCVTALTKTGPAQLSLSRRSSIGFTAAELNLLADWLESPQFPCGLHTLVAQPGPSLAELRSRHAARSKTNSVPRTTRPQVVTPTR